MVANLARLLGTLIPTAFAQGGGAFLRVSGFGIEAVTGPLTIQKIIINILQVTTGTIIYLCVTLFIAGAFFLTISAGDEQRKSLGKDLMVGAAIGLGIVVGAKGILDVAYFFLYGP